MEKETLTYGPHLTTAEVAKRAGIHKDTLLRWLRIGLVPEPTRDRHGWRIFSTEEADFVSKFASSTEGPALSNAPSLLSEKSEPYIGKIKSIDWDFPSAKTSYLTHGIHPYPAKFIPQIPNALIQELSTVGDTVLDIFCGSGTTLVEALLLKRNAVGIDANPLACMITRAKTNAISDADAAAIVEVLEKVKSLAGSIALGEDGSLFPGLDFTSKGWRPVGKTLDFWFEPYVVEELAECLMLSKPLPPNARDLALTAFSSIVVAVSKQDSDTRYVRRDKNIGLGDTFRRFARALEQSLAMATELTEIKEDRFKCSVLEASLLTEPSIPSVDLVVCSPPYPNAYSYHLYHMTRMLWLGMDQPQFKKDEIGSHRKYSSPSKNGANVETFIDEFRTIMEWLKKHLKPNGFACFIVGNSTIRGQHVDNANIIAEAGQLAGFVEVCRMPRTLQSTKKSFNPKIGKIKTENILILQGRG